MSEKQIKISFAIDETSAKRAKLLIDDITRSIQGLVEASSRVGGALSQAMGGGRGGMSVGGSPSITVRGGKTGGGGTSHASSAAGRGSGSGIVTQLLGTSDVGAIRSLVTGTKQAFTGVGADVKTFVDKASSDIGKLQTAVDNLGKSFKDLKGTDIGGGGYGGGGGGGPRGGGGGDWSVKFNHRDPGLPDDPFESAKPKHKFGRMTPIDDPGIESSKKIFGAIAGGRVGDILSTISPVGGAVFGAAKAGFGIGESINQNFADERLARINQTINQPFDTLNRKAQIAQPFLRMHAAVQQKDASTMQAFSDAMNDKEVMKSLGKLNIRREAIELDPRLNTSTATGVAKEAWNSFKNMLSDKTGVSSDQAYAFINSTGVDEVTQKTMRDIFRDNAVAGLDPQAAAQFQQAVDAKRQLQDPTTAMLRNEVYGNAMGRVHQARSIGMSTAIRKNKDGRMTSALEDEEQQLMRGGWTIADKAAGRQQLLSVGLGYGKAVGPIGLISAGIGGLTNAAELVKAGGSMGGSVAAGKSFYQAAQRSVGRGGLDVAVGRDLFGAMAHKAQSSGAYGGSRAAEQTASMMAGLVAGGSTSPLDVGDQQRRMNLVMQGNETFAGFTQGTAAPLYQATSLTGAIAASGGYGGKAEYLRKLPPELLTTIARGGDIPAGAKAVGITADDASKFLKFNRSAPLFEVDEDRFDATTSTGKTLRDVRAAEATGGDFMDVVKSRTGEIKTGEKPKDFQKRRAKIALEVATDLGASMYASGLSPTQDAGTGVFLGQMAQDKDMAPFLKGKGVGAAAPAGAEKEALEQQADVKKRHGELMVKMEGLIKSLKPVSMEQMADATVKGIASGEAGLPGSVGTLISALEVFKSEIDKSGKTKPQKTK
jgi:hypothetical protein